MMKPKAWIGVGRITGGPVLATENEPRSQFCEPWTPLYTQADIDDAVEAERKQWISFADMYPRIGQRCLICLNGCVQHISYIFDRANDGWPFWSDGICEDNIFDALDGHFWMPLPQPPEK